MAIASLHPRLAMKLTNRSASASLNTDILSSPPSLNFQLPQPKPLNGDFRRLPPITPPLTPPKKIKRRRVSNPTTSSDILHLMDILKLPVSSDIYASLLKECTVSQDIDAAMELHDHIINSRIRLDLPLTNRILVMYLSCRLIEDARYVFDKMPVRDNKSWAAMIYAYMEMEDYWEAISLFVEMRIGRRRDKSKTDTKSELLTFPVFWVVVQIITACGHVQELELGKQIHGWILKMGYGKTSFLTSLFMNLYGKLNCSEGIDFAFDYIPSKNNVIWMTKLVNKYKQDSFEEVLSIFNEMNRIGVRCNACTFNNVLKACWRIKNGGFCGRQVHAKALKIGVVNGFVQSGLVEMYVKCGSLREAREAFEMLGDDRNLDCWNAMIMGYVEEGMVVEAIKIVYEMKAVGLELDETLLDEVKCACASIDL